MLAGVMVSTRLGLEATVFYLFVYTLMNLAAFAVIGARAGDRAGRRHRRTCTGWAPIGRCWRGR